MLQQLLADFILKYRLYPGEPAAVDAASLLIKQSSFKNEGHAPSWLLQLLQTLIEGKETEWVPIPKGDRRDINWGTLLSNLNEYTNSELDHRGETAEYLFHGEPSLYVIFDFESYRYAIKQIEKRTSLKEAQKMFLNKIE